MAAEKRSIVSGKNFIAGAISVVFSLFMLMMTSNASSAYPYAVFVLMLCFSIIVIAESVKKADEKFERFSLPEILFIVLLTINPLLARTIGFYVSSFIEVILIFLLISGFKRRTVLTALIFAVVLVIISYAIFTYGLRIRCPTGKLSLI